MNPNYELFDRLMLAIDKYEVETKEEKRALIQRAFDLCSFPRDFFDNLYLIEKPTQSSMVAGIIKDAGGVVTSQSHIIDRLLDKNKMTQRRALEIVQQAAIDGSIVITQSGKRSVYTLPQTGPEKERLDADAIKDIMAIIKVLGGKTSNAGELFNLIMNKRDIGYAEACRLLNKAVECGAVKVIQNGKRKTYFLPED